MKRPVDRRDMGTGRLEADLCNEAQASRRRWHTHRFAHAFGPAVAVLMKQTWHLSTVAVAALIALSLEGCGGGSSGEASKSATQILQDATAAATAASSVHVAGAVAAQGQSVPVDVSVGDKGAVGSSAFSGSKVQLVRVGEDIYVKGAAQLIGGFLGPAAAAKLDDHWLQVPTSLPQLAQLSGVTDKSTLLADAFVVSGGPRKSGTRTVGGTKTIALSGFGADGKSTLLVAVTGTPYPVELISAAGTLTFSGWNAAVSPQAPSDVVSLASLTG